MADPYASRCAREFEIAGPGSARRRLGHRAGHPAVGDRRFRPVGPRAPRWSEPVGIRTGRAGPCRRRGWGLPVRAGHNRSPSEPQSVSSTARRGATHRHGIVPLGPSPDLRGALACGFRLGRRDWVSAGDDRSRLAVPPVRRQVATGRGMAGLRPPWLHRVSAHDQALDSLDLLTPQVQPVGRPIGHAGAQRLRQGCRPCGGRTPVLV